MENVWPEIEEHNAFDWSLSMKEIEKKYLPMAVIAEKKNNTSKNKEFFLKLNEEVNPPKQAIGISRLMTKFPFAYSQITEAIANYNPDLLRWWNDNVLINSKQ